MKFDYDWRMVSLVEVRCTLRCVRVCRGVQRGVIEVYIEVCTCMSRCATMCDWGVHWGVRVYVVVYIEVWLRCTLRCARVCQGVQWGVTAVLPWSVCCVDEHISGEWKRLWLLLWEERQWTVDWMDGHGRQALPPHYSNVKGLYLYLYHCVIHVGSRWKIQDRRQI